MIDVSEYIWKLDMLKIFIASELDFSMIYKDTMGVLGEQGNLVHLKADIGSFDEFLFYTSLRYEPIQFNHQTINQNELWGSTTSS